MSQDPATQLVNSLYRANKLTDLELQHLREKMTEGGKNLEDLLRKLKMVGDEDIAEAKSKIFSVPFINLRGHDIAPNVLKILAADVMRKNKMVFFEETARELHVGLVDPGNFEAVKLSDFAANERRKKAKIFVIAEDTFNEIMEKAEYSRVGELGEEVASALGKVQREGFVGLKKKEEVSLHARGDIEEVVKSAPVSEIVDTIIAHAVEERASDIHIEPVEEGSRVRYRVDGELRNALVLPAYVHPAVISRIKVLSNLKLDETRKPQDGRMRLDVQGKRIDFRVSTMPLIDREKVALRILDTSLKLATLEGLGFRSEQVEIMKNNITKSHGFILSTGPTGSGKTTTMYALLNLLNRAERNIVTLEDPIEYYLDGVNQSQVNSEIGFSFASGLRSILRQDPNVIMVGEIRDDETAELAIHAALTGHLVLSTLHTSNMVGSIPRLIDMHIEPFLLASTINLVMAQRLVRRICPACKKTVKPLEKTKQWMEKVFENLSEETKKEYTIRSDNMTRVFRSEGCKECNNTGYRGRVVIAELFENDREIQQMILQGFQSSHVKEYFSKKGYITLQEDGLLKALAGLTTIEEVMRATQE